MRAESANHLPDDDPNRVGVQAIRALIAEIIDDARRDGSHAADVDADAVIDVLFALTRGLTEQTAEPRPHVHRGTLATAKRLIRGTLFRSSHATGG